MLQKAIYILLLIKAYSSFADSIPISERNETNLLLAINSQQYKLRYSEYSGKLIAELRTSNFQLLTAELQRHVKLIDGLVKDLNIQERQEKILDNILKAMDVQSIRTEQEKQGKFIDGLVKESDIQLVRADISSLRAEQERLGKDGVDKEAGIKSIREELERQGNLISGLAKESNIQLLRTDIQSIRQEKLTDGLVNPRSCAEAKINGIHDILIPSFSSQTFKVACDAETREGGWTIILSRLDGSVDFYRNWTECQRGFGDLNGEFFLGLDKIHALTADRKQELLVILEDFEGDERFETYDDFAIKNEDQQYELHTLGTANGTAGDSLSYHRGMKFSTFDRDNDDHSRVNCAAAYTGAWWYRSCHHSNLAGKYNDNTHAKGVNWNAFRKMNYSLKKAVMMIRPRK